ncbi:zona pellucida sperm-binding protein 1-like [Sardina pilchardus]|uniref:zona pellucida sperm-binding protein 1-like n=1 Tax=Sardina pilchardus TaxID=27697 RepID=UPI002E115CCC
MFVLFSLVVGLALTQTRDLSSYLEDLSEGEYGSFSFVQNKDGYTVGQAVMQSSDMVEDNDSQVKSEKGFNVFTPNSQELPVECTDSTMKVELPAGPLTGIRILGSATVGLLQVESCRHTLTKTPEKNTLTISFNGCPLTLERNHYKIRLLYVTDDGKVEVNSVSCPDPQYFNSTRPQSDSPDSGPISKSGSKCADTTVAPVTRTTLTPVPMPGGCGVSQEKQIECGSGISASACLVKGCCVDPTTQKCYYPVNVCTLDRHFVFVIPHDLISVPVNPASLVIAGDRSCKPVVVNSKFALFKFSVTECGTRVYEIGESLVYLAEVQTVLRALKMKYGIITRDNPIRIMVECRYPKNPLPDNMQLATTGFLVMSPVLPSTVTSEGLYGVQLRIAEDETFSKFLPHYHQLLRLMLGKRVYLEVRILSPKAEAAVLLVHYCVAYPRSARNALVLLYEGCPNALDSASTAILHMANLPQNRHTRRFMIKAFQFMDQTTNKFLNEEIYFMCSAEVCLPSKTTCKETCFDKKVSP